MKIQHCYQYMKSLDEYRKSEEVKGNQNMLENRGSCVSSIHSSTMLISNYLAKFSQSFEHLR